MTLRSPSLLKLMGEPRVLINPDDARMLGIRDGDWVEIETRRGKIRMRAKLGNIQRGVVAVPFHFKANRLTSDALNKAGTPEFKFSVARLRKLERG